ncbi:MAG: hypothetical protein LLG40_06625 [Deltaproteobacteria bacterium]|nr:hypothetical protein [Deltaproteobacteria bacterium]
MYQLSTSVNDDILEILLTGTVAGHIIPKIQKEIQAIRTEKRDIILLDIRPVTKGKTYTYVDTLYYIKIPDKATGKTAILDNPENGYVKSFIEKIPWGSFLKVRWFDNIDEAKDWLKSSGRGEI